MSKEKRKTEVLGHVRNPLVFFALALLLIEGIIGLVVAKSNLSEVHTFYSVFIMAGLFLVVVGVVTLITIKWPRHLYEEIVKEFETTRFLREYIESIAFRDVIEDIILNTVKHDCIEKNIQPMSEEQ